LVDGPLRWDLMIFDQARRGYEDKQATHTMSRRFALEGGLIIFRESSNPRPSTGRELTGEPNMAKDRAKVLNISGVVDGDEIQNYVFDGVMEKPLDIEELRDQVDEAVER
jgi:hypothetical protein